MNAQPNHLANMGTALLRQMASHRLSGAEVEATRGIITDAVDSGDAEMLRFISEFSMIRCDIAAMAAIVQAMRDAGHGDQVPHLTLNHVLTYYDLQTAAAQYGRDVSPTGTSAPAETTRKRAALLLALIHHNLNLVSTVMTTVRQLGTVDPEHVRNHINGMRSASAPQKTLEEALS
jgi:hypothetical protein